MNTTQRTSISSPASGLLVFDITTDSFWFYSDSWTDLSGDHDKIVDANGDTRVEVEQSTNGDTIHFTTAGSERMTIDESGNTRIGDGTNNTYIESDGSLSYEGTAVRWDDLRIPVTSLKERDVDMPDWDVFIDDTDGPGIYLHWFNDEDGSINKEEELFFTVQMPHGWKEGSNIEPHVHWTARDDVSGKNVEWGLQYSWTNGGEYFNAIPTDIIYTDSNSHAPAAFRHIISGFPVISGSGHNLSSILICRLFVPLDNKRYLLAILIAHLRWLENWLLIVKESKLKIHCV